MSTAIIGTGGLGSVIARQLASGGETLRLSSADTESIRFGQQDQRSEVARVSCL
jgi:predicted dinucleotide-binding enzyme